MCSRSLHPPLLTLLAATLAVAACEGSINTGEPDTGTADSGETCEIDCPPGQRCDHGVCRSPDDPCFGMSCPTGTRCSSGSCVTVDPCEGITCSPGDACQAGVCVSGAADDDGDEYLARDDCDDSDPLIHPGAVEVCNGRDDDCDEATADGDADCPDYCCGTEPACSECCRPAHCGDGDWSCTAGSCGCPGLLCGDTCVAGGECCSPSDCGTGEWTCEDHHCGCSGTITP